MEGGDAVASENLSSSAGLEKGQKCFDWETGRSGIRTRDKRICNPPAETHNPLPLDELETGGQPLAEPAQNPDAQNAVTSVPTDPDLAALVAAWPKLPEALKAGIVAMVKAVR